MYARVSLRSGGRHPRNWACGVSERHLLRNVANALAAALVVAAAPGLHKILSDFYTIASSFFFLFFVVLVHGLCWEVRSLLLVR